MYFATYVAEEVFTNAADFRVATGCVGTRTGLRGQAKRCNLKELCEHIWMTTTGEAEPDKTKTIWSPDAFDIEKMKAVEMHKWIMDVTYEVPWMMKDKATGAEVQKKFPDGTLRTKKQPIPKPGYTGFTDASKLIAGMTGQEGYFRNVRQWGQWQKRAAQEFARWSDPPAKVDLELKNRLFKANVVARESAELLIDLREMDIAKNSITPAKKGAKVISDLFGHPVELRPRTSQYIGTWQEIDNEATIKKYASAFGSEDAARKALQNAWKTMATTPEGAEHASALRGSQMARNGMACGL